ncbi:MAG TPA: type 4a pilus biogenesis protein PilO [Acidobacteriota bacterium]|nr:type 4a pilus biogenesis protein PilO [Acidobacteriota bacterium]
MAIKNFRFDNLPRPVQIVLFTVLIILLAAAFYIYHLKDLKIKHDALQAEIKKLELSVAQGTAVETRLQRFKEEVALLEERLATLQSILPSEKETPTLLRSIQDMAASSNLIINKFAPQPMVPRAFYSDWPIEIELEGNYHGLGLFFEKISQATRVIDVGTISIRNIHPQTDPKRTLVASCTATTYVFREEEPSQIDEKEITQ